jgi:protein-tyrosine phosphatase
MLAQAAPVLVQILRFLVSRERLPALVHCAAGKDRTGITVAVLLAAAGVDDADIVADYTVTGLRLARVNASLARRAGYRVPDPPPQPALLPETPIRTVLAALHATYGGAEQFLINHGTTPAELDRWRALLLQDAPDDDREDP